MSGNIPGTTLKYSESARNSAFSVVSPVLEATGGLTLSQLSTLTGLSGTTIQNWIKRGWVSATVGKKYSKKQVVRILLINMLRGAMKLEDIVGVMSYVNGDVDDVSDDIISDIHLYDMLCRMIFAAFDEQTFDPDKVRKLVEMEMSENAGKITDTQKLGKALYVMVLAYVSGYLKAEMEKGLLLIAPLN